MTDSRADRRGALWGLAFIAFFAAGAALVGAAGDSGDTPREVVTYYRDHDELQLVWALLGAAGFCLLPFLGALRTLLRRAEGGRDDIATLVFGAGLVFTALLFVAGAALAVVPATADWNDNYRIDATTSDTIATFGWLAWIGAGTAGAVLTGAASLVAWRTRALPRWLAVLGWIAAVVAFAGMVTWGAGTAAVALWILLVSIVMLVRSRQPTERAVAAPASS